jgi:predicted dehydrogenase
MVETSQHQFQDTQPEQTDMAPSIRAGIIGYGPAGSILHAPLIGHTPGMVLAGAATSQADKLKADWPEAVAFATPEALIDSPDIDLIVIASPNQTHVPLAMAALAAGKHVVIDKPFAITVAEAEALVTLAETRGLVLSAFHNRRWDADFLTIQSLLASGELGRLTQVSSSYNRFRPAIRQRWREQPGPGAGLWCDLGSHLIDQSLTLFGKPESIALDLAVQREGGLVDDWFHCVLHYGSMRVILHADVLSTEPGPRFVLNGTHGSFVKYGLDPQEIALRDAVRPSVDATGWGLDTNPGTLTLMEPEAGVRTLEGLRGDWRLFYSGMATAINTGTPAPVPAREALEVVRLIELGYQSHAEGRRVRV